MMIEINGYKFDGGGFCSEQYDVYKENKKENSFFDTEIKRKEMIKFYANLLNDIISGKK